MPAGFQTGVRITKMEELIGKTPVYPVLFDSGKVAGYFTLAAGVYYAVFRKTRWSFMPDVPAFVLFPAGALLTVVSLEKRFGDEYRSYKRNVRRYL